MDEFYYPDELTNPADILNSTDPLLQEKRESLKPEEMVNPRPILQADAKIRDFINAQKASNTLAKTRSDVKKFEAFLQQFHERRGISNLPLADLDTHLCNFFIQVKRNDGQDFEPDSLTGLQRSIQRHLGETDSKLNILKDEEFRRSREVLAARRKQLVSLGKGNVLPNAATALTDADEEKLFQQGSFGMHNPVSLQRTLWWFLSLHFGFRARDESHKLRWGDVKLSEDPETGNEILVWVAERGTKTRHGQENAHRRAFDPIIQATRTDRCPIMFYKEFARRRPQEMNTPDAPFYLAVNHRRKPDSEKWFMKSPLGKNEIGKFMSTAAKEANIAAHRKVANHSVRKTSISRLLDANCPEIFVAQHSGHKRLESLSHYKQASVAQQRQMSMIISRTSKSEESNQLALPSKSSDNKENQRALVKSSAEQVRAAGSSSSSRLEICNLNDQTFSTDPKMLFQGSTIGSISNCTFNIINNPSNFSFQPDSHPSEHVPPKRRRCIIDSDSD